MRQEFQQAVANTTSCLWPQLLRTLIRHIAAVLGVLTRMLSVPCVLAQILILTPPLLLANDIPFVLRIVVQAMLPGTPADVAAEAQSLSSRVQTVVPPEFNVSPNTLGLDELCPACHTKLPLHDITAATCPNGHVWGASSISSSPSLRDSAADSTLRHGTARCSITSFVLSTPMVRTCVGCGRKALLPPQGDHPVQNWMPPAAKSWLVEELLHAVQRCFFCGNNFVTLV